MEIGDYYYYEIIDDSALIFYTKAIKLADKYLNSKNEPIDFYLRFKANAHRYIGIIYNGQGFYDNALESFFTSLSISQQLKDNKGMSSTLNNIGGAYYTKGAYNKAADYYLKSLKIKEQLSDYKGIAATYSNLGLIYDNQQNYELATDYHLKALEINEKYGYKNGIATVYGNLGNIYYEQKLFDKALKTYLKSLELKEELGDLIGMSNTYGNVANVYAELKEFNKSLEYYTKALEVKKELGDKHGVAVAYANIALFHLDLAYRSENNTEKKNHLKNALDIGIVAYNMSLEVNALPLQNDAANNLKETYTQIGDFAEALRYANIYIATQDSMFGLEKTKALTEMQVKYEAEKKQIEIEKLEKQKLLDAKTIEVKIAENNKQKIIIFFVLGSFLIVLVFSIIILRMFRQKRKANILLAEQKDEIEAQRDTVTKQKEKIEEIHKELTDSIEYAKHIQKAVLPKRNFLDNVLSEHFVYFKPLSIVSGDFYWATQIDNLTVFTVADCTGHGVPGAFMSMLGISFLNEIVRKSEITQSNHVLNLLRENIINALGQSGTQGESTDGMDISFCALNKETNMLQWSGANNPLYIVRDNELLEYKSDKMPISINRRMDPYTNHEIQLRKDDMIYLFTDGYADQFGGEKGHKFKYKPFKELLISISKKTMEEQIDILDKTMKVWKGKHPQIDDITILGFRI